MFWVLKRTVKIRRFFWAPKTYVKTNGKKKYSQFYAEKFCLSWAMIHTWQSHSHKSWFLLDHRPWQMPNTHSRQHLSHEPLQRNFLASHHRLELSKPQEQLQKHFQYQHFYPILSHDVAAGSDIMPFLAHRIRISEILPWDRKSYLSHVILHRLSCESCTYISCIGTHAHGRQVTSLIS